ncbi:diacylglycerol/lipid kinase family protein [Kordiimonas aestuarii]|uniref:diacylglycerol/lipid kinase family protein n=1 Tax=Kordiimonas aestuarii TaxID=1005925 RepID=UPI0021CE7A23|nr:diacylglycerol kinase family protein [Kordiimonas aestuarii]
MGERVVIIKNPISGGGKGPFISAVAERLLRGGQQVTIVPTEGPVHASKIAEELAIAGEVDVIIAAGGDGTIREVAEGAFGHGVALGIIPAGTANVLARELGYMPHGRIGARHVSDVLLSRSLKDLYPFDVHFGGENHMGVCWLGAGFDARVLEYVSPALKAKVGRMSFVPATFKALWRERSANSISWTMEGGGAGHAYWAVIANIQRYAGPFILTRQTRVNSPGLACLMMEGKGPLARAVDQIALLFGRLDRRAGIRQLGNGSLSLGDEDTPLQLDGDFIGYGGATITPRLVPIAFRAHV